MTTEFGPQRDTDKTAHQRLPRWVLPLGIIALALAVRCVGLDAQSIWFDEGWSIHLAREPLLAALGQIASPGHTHPPGYYLLLMGWERLFGSGVLAMRMLSALIGAATVGAVYALGRRLYDRRTGTLAALLLAFSPAHIVYSQETRMYALLILAGALSAIEYYHSALRGEYWSPWRWALFVAAQVLAAYTHFFAFFVLVTLAGWWLVVIWRRGGEHRMSLLRRWLACQAISMLLFLPWLSVALRRAATHATEGALPPSLLAFIDQVWAFLLGGHIALLGREPLYASLARMLALAVGLAVLYALARGARRRETLYFTLQTVLPLAMVWTLMQVRPGFHPRYVLMALVPLCLLLARGTLVLWRAKGWERVAGSLLLALWIATASLAARALITDPYYDRDNARATAAYIQERMAGANTPLVWVDNEDWALRYYVERIALPSRFWSLDDLATDDTAHLVCDLAEHNTVALIKWHQGENDKRELLPYLLAREGHLVETRYLPGYTVTIYDTSGEPTVERAETMRPNASWGALRLIELDVESHVPADEAVTVRCIWRVEAPMDRDYKLNLALIDAGLRPVATLDRVLRDGHGLHTRTWAPEQEIISYHALRPAPGTPPVTYTLRIGLYAEEAPEGFDLLDAAGAPAGKHLEAAHIVLAPALEPASKIVDWETLGLAPLPEPVELAPSLLLVARSDLPERVYTGEPITVRTAWRSASGALPAYAPCLRLVRDGQVMAMHTAAPAYGAYPTTAWRQDEMVCEWRDLTVPVDLTGGAATLQLLVEAGAPVNLGTIDIEAVPRTLTPPTPDVALDVALGPCVLLGYDLPRTDVTSTEEVPLTLYWRTTARMDTPYTVFTHLLDPGGRLIAQHDSPPANGQRPTTGWLPSEYVTDDHVLRWVDSAYRGKAIIEVGLYDAASGQRLLTPDGDSRLLLVDSIMVR